MSLLGQFVGGMLKQKPKVPDFKAVSAQDEQLNAAKGNRANFGEIAALAGEVDNFNQEQLMARMRQLIPDLDSITSKASGNINDMLSGKIPDDVSAEIFRKGASRGFAGGYGGSGFGRNLTTRDLGLSSLQMTQAGLDSASRWMQTARGTLTAPQMDVTSMFVSPAQQLANKWQNTTAEMNLKWMKNQIDAQHDWRTQLGNSIQQTDAQITSMAMNVGGSLLGGAM